MIDCLEFRRRAGAEPFAEVPEVEAHRSGCAACARHLEELREMDGVIRRALAVDVAPQARAAATRRRAFAIAASVAAAAALGAVLLVGAPRASVAREVVGHVEHEPGATAGRLPLSAGAIAAVLEPEGVRLLPGAGDVTFAARCVFDGRIVPHLVVRTPDGPVTVLLLRHRELRSPLRLDEPGYAGVVLPAPRGSIAVVGEDVADIEAVAKSVIESVDWGR